MELLSGCLDNRIANCEVCRLPTGVSALNLRLEISDIASLQMLRDSTLNGTLEESMNAAIKKELNGDSCQLQIDCTRFLELYEDVVLCLTTLTEQQQRIVQDLAKHKAVLLRAPAGAGKTFVTVQRVLETLRKPSATVLFVSPTRALGYHFINWLAMRLSAPGREESLDFIKDVLPRLVMLHEPFDTPYTPIIQEGRIEYSLATNATKFALAVVDEGHNLFGAGCSKVALEDQLDETTEGASMRLAFIELHMNIEELLVLADESQSDAADHTFPEFLYHARLTQVVRSTKRVVQGAASFRWSPCPDERLRAIATDGPPLQSFLFEAAEHKTLAEQYAEQTMRALQQIAQRYAGLGWHRRLALLVPNEQFRAGLWKSLGKRLKDEYPQKNLGLVSFAESLRNLPERLHAFTWAPEKRREQIVLDTVNNADGLEMLMVVCIGLDDKILDDGEGDPQTTFKSCSQLYKAFTRAQFLAMVVQHHVPHGWLEFLATVQFDAGLPPQDDVDGSPQAAEIQRRALLRIQNMVFSNALAGPRTDRDEKQAQKSSLLRASAWLSQELCQCCPWSTSSTPSTSTSRPEPRSGVWDTRSNDIRRVIRPFFQPVQAEAGPVF